MDTLEDQQRAVATHLRIIRSAAWELELEADRYERESGISEQRPDTIPAPAEEPRTDPDMAPIAAGDAQLHVSGAFRDLLAALNRAEAVCDAIARQLDSSSR
jgi:hypothetical protein